MTDRTPAGWYRAPHASEELRYWDGQKWLDWTPEQAVAASFGPSVGKQGLPWWAWVVIALLILMVLFSTIISIGSGMVAQLAASQSVAQIKTR